MWSPLSLLVANNIYAALLAETGVIGFGTFGGASIGLAVLAFRAYRGERGGDRLWVAASLAAVAAMATYFLLSPTFTLLYQWAILGLIAAHCPQQDRGCSEQIRRHGLRITRRRFESTAGTPLAGSPQV